MDCDISRKICLIPLPLQTLKDKIVWGLSNNGTFPSSLLLGFKIGITILLIVLTCYRKCGSQLFLLKLKCFRRMIHERLQTRKCLSRFVKNIDTLCLLGNEVEEDQCHLFYKCCFANKVWNLTFGNLNSDYISTNDNFLDWIDSLNSNDKDSLSNLSKVILNCRQIGWEELTWCS